VGETKPDGGERLEDWLLTRLTDAKDGGRLIEQRDELLKALKGYVEWFGPAHDALCAGDDTCECTGKPLNDLVNAVIANAEAR